MGMPQIPDGKYRPEFDETMIDLLESIALEEMALSHVMNAEGEKMQEVIRQYSMDNICFCQLEEANKSANGMINTLIMKEWLLLSKLNVVIDVKKTLDPRCHNKY